MNIEDIAAPSWSTAGPDYTQIEVAVWDNEEPEATHPVDDLPQAEALVDFLRESGITRNITIRATVQFTVYGDEK